MSTTHGSKANAESTINVCYTVQYTSDVEREKGNLIEQLASIRQLLTESEDRGKILKQGTLWYFIYSKCGCASSLLNAFSKLLLSLLFEQITKYTKSTRHLKWHNQKINWINQQLMSFGICNVRFSELQEMNSTVDKLYSMLNQRCDLEGNAFKFKFLHLQPIYLLGHLIGENTVNIRT